MSEPGSSVDVRGFIVGTSRGGTTFMSKVLNVHPDVVCFGESAYFGRVWQEPAGNNGRLSVEQTTRLLNGFKTSRWGPERGDVGVLPDWVGLSHERWTTLLDRLVDETKLLERNVEPNEPFDLLCRAMAEAAGKRVVIEKTPHHLGATDRIERFYSRARYVLMLREPYAFIRSYKNQGRQLGERSRKLASEIYHPIAAALLWRGYAKQALALVQRAPERTLRVSLDAIREDEASTLEAVQRHLGLDVVDLAGVVQPDNSSTQGGADELDAGEVWWINRIAGTTMSEAGFERRGVSFGPKAAGYAAKFPIWSVRYVARQRKSVHGSFAKHVMRFLRPK